MIDHQRNQARRDVARVMLEALKDTNFVLTGASALAEHRIINRETRDVDLFTIGDEGQRIPDAIPLLREALAQHDATLTVVREFPGFVEGRISWGEYEISIDLGADWRAYPPVTLDIGPVLDVRDSIGSKVAALYGRQEARDYADVALIVRDGRWSTEDIMTMGAANDPGLEREQLAQFLDPDFERFPTSSRFRKLGIDEDTETLMRDALTFLRCAALGEDVDLETVEAARIAASGRTQPPTEQMAQRDPASPASRPATRGVETDRGAGYDR